jgi:hypothetical protein
MPPLANGALCLSTRKHNGKSGTAEIKSWTSYIIYIYKLPYIILVLLKIADSVQVHQDIIGKL